MVWHLRRSKKIFFVVLYCSYFDYPVYWKLCESCCLFWCFCFILCTLSGFRKASFTTRAEEKQLRATWNEITEPDGPESTTARERFVFYCRKTLSYKVWTHYNCNWTNPSLELLQQPCSCADIHHVNLRAIENPEWRNSQYRTESARGSRSRDASLCVSCI